MKFTFAMTAALAAAVLAAPLLPADTTSETRSLDHYSHNILARDVTVQPAAAAKRDVEAPGVEGDGESGAATEAELEARSKVGDIAKKLGNLAKDKGKKLLGRDGMTAEQYAQEYDEEHPEQAAQEAEEADADAASLEARGKLEDIAKKLGQIAKDKGKKLLGRDGMTAEQYAQEYDEEHPEEAAHEADLEARSEATDLAKKLGKIALDKGKKLVGARDGMTAEQYAQEYDEEHPEQTAQEAAVIG